MNDRPDWFVLLIGGPSGVGKTTAAAQVAQRLGAPWLQVDDLRLAMERSGVPVPNADAVGTFDAPGSLVALGELLTPAIEVVIENHVDQRDPVVIEGDGILPSLFDRPSVRARSTNGRTRAVLLYEPDEAALHANMQSRRRGLASRAHARKNVLFGGWLRREAEQRGLPTVPARPWDTLTERILAASGLSDHARPATAR
ncbi:MAG TPA: AAA family ATPase [Chloroflexota bacterium]|nr:AAA family ATPase [Chloroflexota bacterium]